MCWTYFTGAAPAEHALDRAEPRACGLLAIRAYLYAHIAVLLGIVFAAAEIHSAVAHPADPPRWAPALATTASAGLHLAAVVAIVTAMLVTDARRNHIPFDGGSPHTSPRPITVTGIAT